MREKIREKIEKARSAPPAPEKRKLSAAQFEAQRKATEAAKKAQTWKFAQAARSSAREQAERDALDWEIVGETRGRQLKIEPWDRDEVQAAKRRLLARFGLQPAKRQRESRSYRRKGYQGY